VVTNIPITIGKGLTVDFLGRRNYRISETIYKKII